MRYLFLTAAALALSALLGYAFSRLVFRCGKAGRAKRILAGLLAAILLFSAAGLAYLGVYSRAADEAMRALEGSGSVTVKKLEGGYLFDGPGDEKAIVFYPGGKVQTEAYASLMLLLAEGGTDCFLADMPFRIAFFRINAADSFISGAYDGWFVMGHSLGGFAASSYASSHPDGLRGIILLASYPVKELSDKLCLLSVYGSEDGILEMDEYEKGRGYWPSDSAEAVIQGGNHARFGSYGIQKGDGEAAISEREQQEETARVIAEWLEEH